MSPEKVTVMILYVDLKCSCCYKKVRKLLCKFPEIRDQVFDEEKNKVTITVVCCDPERLRDKLCCKGGKAIQSIEIVEPEPPKPKPKPADPPKKVEPVVVKKPDPAPPPAQPKKPDPVVVPAQPKMPDPLPPPAAQPKKLDPKPPPKMPDPAPPPAQPKMPDPKPPPEPKKPDPAPPKMPDPMPPPQPDPVPIPMEPFWPTGSTCCQECYEGRGGGPCHFGFGRPVPPPPGPCYGDYPQPSLCYDNCGYGYGSGYGSGYSNRAPCYVTRCDYFSEENARGCSIM